MDYKKLIDILRNGQPHVVLDYRDDFADAIEALLTEREAVWISTKEKLPELTGNSWASKMVIAAQEGGGVSPMEYERAIVRGKSVERWKFFWGRIADVKVTHWMPLPAPPDRKPESREEDD